MATRQALSLKPGPCTLTARVAGRFDLVNYYHDFVNNCTELKAGDAEEDVLRATDKLPLSLETTF
jgi:hypothetical protein